MKKKIVIILIAVLVVALIIGIIFIKKDKKVSNEEKTNNKKSEEKVTIKKEDQLEADTIKEDESKDYVYEANYKFDSSYKVKDYKSLGQIDQPNQLLRGKGTVEAPYININTEDGKKVNKEIKEVYVNKLKAIEKLMKCEEKDPTQDCGGTYFNYIFYKNDNYISVIVITTETTKMDSPTQYYGYVFDIKNGKLLNSSDIAKKKNMTIDQLENKTRSAIDSYTKTQDKDFNSNAYTKYLSETYKLLKSSINNQGYITNDKDGIIFFFDNDNKLKVLVNIKVDLDIDKYAYLLDIE